MGWSATELLSTVPYWALSNESLSLCESWGGHFEHARNKLFLQGFELSASCDSMKCQTSIFSFDFNTSTMMKIAIYIVIVLHGSVVA